MFRMKLSYFFVILFISLCVFPFMRAEGVVSQIDGTILPDSNNLLQQGLETSEGVSDPNDPNYLDATMDAHTFPQIFLPPEYGTGQVVTFYIVQEEAGFENSFGWYNVGDTSRLFKVIDCNTWNGGVNHEAGAVVTVDFDEEFDNNNWDGGFIGFYLITPEDNNTSNNCGDFDPPEYFGHIYYSEAELNGDGDYVHTLVYTSKNHENSFYFAHEDLFRGGDNDFSDQTVRVQGLTPPCIPEPEVCDGIDNNCSGLTDADDPFLIDTGGPCGSDEGECEPGIVVCIDANLECEGEVGPESEICDGRDNDCNGLTDDNPIDAGGICGTNEGECSAGVTVCDNGALVCDGEVGPQPEECNGKDDDCDGVTDNDPIGEDEQCGTDEGECQYGQTACVNGTMVCQGGVMPTPEVCDGLDNNCDGAIDNDPIDEGGTCGTNVGECEYGTTVCDGGALVCQGAVGPQPEMCDGKDNDCNGAIDDNPVDAGGICGSDVGECSAGVLVCSSGVLICDGAIGPQDEVCDGLDNNCNGVVDDDPIDAGDSCGSDIGECEAGTMICQNGALICDGAVGPQSEVCDGLDNDCNGLVDDNPIDEGGTCGTSVGECEPGINVCVGGALVCQGAVGPQEEICDGKDNDCDGVIDNGNPGGGGACGITDEGRCELGVLECIAGGLSCVGAVNPRPEACNCLDDDCDGVTDNGAECPEPYECIDCACRRPCSEGEFECPGGMVCEDGFCVETPCYGVECSSGEMCVDGECIPICDIIECGDGYVCEEGRCIEDNCYGFGCPEEGEVCLDGSCVPDPCDGVECGEGSFCRFGECVDTCERVVCEEGRMCRDGECVIDPCADKDCESGFVCIDGQCVLDPCGPVDCGKGRICEEGRCIDDPCRGVTCPYGGVCRNGQCEDPEGYIPGSEGEKVLSTGAGGCACSVSGSDNGQRSYLWALFLLCFALWTRRKRVIPVRVRGTESLADNGFQKGEHPNASEKTAVKERSFFRRIRPMIFLITIVAALPIVFAGCELAPFQFEGSDAYVPNTDSTTGPDAYECEITNGGVEICDGRDNNCNGETDEGFNLERDPENCGACGNNCSLPGAYTDCRDGECVFLECAPGFYDLNNNLEDGCEYECIPTNGGNEVCDGLDNNCDGFTDEGFDLESDPLNCGECGVVCAFNNAEEDCVEGECVLVECLPGFIDLNGLVPDGCEYFCVETNGGVEICDGLDNDCNGLIDDNVDTSSDPMNCGACGSVCSRPNAITECIGGNCEIVDCVDDYVDANDDPSDGCEYPCVVTNEGVEICDGVDNDCDGTIDNNLTDTGGGCGTSDGECEQGLWVCSAGTLVCSGGKGPQPEVCDGKDNDCDGQTDNGTIDSGGPCGTGLGECQMGTLVCESGTLECQGGVEPQDEICDGKDNDCDGLLDNNPVDTGGVCGTDEGECESGILACSSGSLICSGNKAPQPETCDGKDNDCDGITDNNTVDTNDLCGSSVGECQFGVTICENAVIVCDGEVPQEPEECDGFDNDCNGIVDDNTLGSGEVCGVTDQSHCEYGLTECINASMVCEGNIDPEPFDVCDGIDNDCDGITDPNGCVDVTAQDIRLDDNTNPGEFNSVQLNMAASGDRIHVVWLDSRGGYARIYHTCSNDGGQSWITEERLDSGSSQSVKPKVLIDPTGWVYVAYEDFDETDFRRVYFHRASSCAPGAFGSVVRLDNTNSEDSLNVHMAADGSGSVFVVWEDFVEGSGSTDSYRNIMFAASDDFGQNWSGSSPARVNQEPSDPTDAYATLPRVAIGDLGRASIVWADARHGATEIYYNHTDNDGAAFLASDVRISTGTAGASASKFPRIVSNQTGDLVVGWEDLRRGYSDIRYNYSDDNGATWQLADLQLDWDKEDHDSYDLTLMRGEGDRIHAGWRDFREGLPRVRVATSIDKGVSFGGGVKASFSPCSATEPQFAADEAGKVFVVFACNPDGFRDIFLNFSLDNGMSFQPTDLRLDVSTGAGEVDCFTPRLSAGDLGNAYGVWVDTRANGREGDIYFNFVQE